MLHLEDMISYIIGHFQNSTKDTFCQGNLHQDDIFKSKNDQHKYLRGHLGLSKKVKYHLQKMKIEQVMSLTS